MIFNQHSDLEGTHAPFAASQSHWLRYSDDKIVQIFQNLKANEQGTILHLWAQNTIELGIKQPRSKKTLYSYVNDAIGFRMKTEVVLYYSPMFFGTADAISFRKNFLRIHDLKTGKHPGKMEQLMVYSALFCLEYKIKPETINIELRIYQNDDILVVVPEPEEVQAIMDKIVHYDILLSKCEPLY